jgi:hypothetical protein
VSVEPLDGGVNELAAEVFCADVPAFAIRLDLAGGDEPPLSKRELATRGRR